MRPDDFDAAIKRLELIFRPLEEGQVNLYWEIFRKVPKVLFDDAVLLLASAHPYRRFPIPAEIWRAVYVARDNREAAIERKPEPPCPLCEGMGWKLEKRIEAAGTHEVAVFCSCSRGQKMKEAHRKGEKKRGGRRLEYPGETGGASENPDTIYGDETQEEES